MKAVLQRVLGACIEIEQKKIAQINRGIVIFLGFSKKDEEKQVRQLSKKILNFRIFEDDQRKMNLSLMDAKAELLIVPQFTLVANCSLGRRPSFLDAAPPTVAKELYFPS